MVFNPNLGEDRNADKHYKVKGRIDGKWFDNDLVFATKEEAKVFGNEMIEAGGVDKFRIVPTQDPVNWTRGAKDCPTI